MKKPLITTTNSLADIITWLKDGYMVCIHSSRKALYFFSTETLTEIKGEKLIYIDVEKDASLLDDDEWPWYIKQEGFVEYTSINVLPANNENIHNLIL